MAGLSGKPDHLDTRSNEEMREFDEGALAILGVTITTIAESIAEGDITTPEEVLGVLILVQQQLQEDRAAAV